VFNFFIYLFAAFIIGCAHIFHPFIFSLGIETASRYFLSFFVFCGTLLYLIGTKRSLVALPFFLFILIMLTLSAILTRHDAFDNLMIIIHISLMYSLFLLFTHSLSLQEAVIRLLFIYTGIISINTIVGFTYVNFFDNNIRDVTSIYGMFGQDDSHNGYFYIYKSYFGSFANAHVWGDGQFRAASFMFEPNAYGIFIAMNIALLIKKYGLSSISKKATFVVMLVSGFTTLSVTFLAITGVGLILYLGHTLGRRSKFIIIMLSIIAYIIFSETLFDRSSASVRLSNAKQLIDIMLTEFSVGDHLFGRGAGWSIVEIGQGIDSGYLAFYTQYGIFFAITAIIIFIKAGYGSYFAMTTLLLSPVATNFQFSYIYVLYIALLITVSVVRDTKTDAFTQS